MSNNVSPFLSINHEPQHFSDYGFDPQIDYFKVLEEARTNRVVRETTTRSKSTIDLKHFKLQKPIVSRSSDDQYHYPSKKIKKKNNSSSSSKKRWWKNALLSLFKLNKQSSISTTTTTTADDEDGRRPRQQQCFGGGGCHRNIGSISGPVYVTESRSGSSTPHRMTTVITSSGRLAKKGSSTHDLDDVVPYVKLREMNGNTVDPKGYYRNSGSGMPIYLVT